jgi:hypothetical protein
MNNAVLIIPHFGNLSTCNYLPLFLATVRYQPFDVLLYTDDDLEDVPSNVIVKKTKIDSIFERAEEVIGEKITSRFYYKLCDLRVIYGQMFEEEISKYDYWGWGDLDVIYGTFEPFPRPGNGTPDLFCNAHKRLEMSLVQSESPLGLWYASGHFVMMRNDHRSRLLLEKLPTAKRLIKEPVNRYIDEHLVPTVLVDTFKNRTQVYSTDLQYVNKNKVQLKNGNLYHDGQFLNYLHWYTDKSRVTVKTDWREIPRSLKIKDYIK